MRDSAPTRAQELAALLADGFSETAPHTLDLDRELRKRSGEDEGAPKPPLPFEDGQFDLVFSLGGLFGFAEGEEEWLGEARRLLREGGLLVAAVDRPRARGSREPGRDWIAVRRDAAGSAAIEKTAPVEGLAALLDELDASHRGEIDSMREGFHRELMRKALRIAELESAETGTPRSWAIAERVAAQYEATVSWRLTRPVRALKRALSER